MRLFNLYETSNPIVEKDMSPGALSKEVQSLQATGLTPKIGIEIELCLPRTGSGNNYNPYRDPEVPAVDKTLSSDTLRDFFSENTGQEFVDNFVDRYLQWAEYRNNPSIDLYFKFKRWEHLFDFYQANATWLIWPSGEVEEAGFDDAGANKIARMLRVLGEEAEVTRDSSAARRKTGTSSWQIVEDISINPTDINDSGLEVISPPTEYSKASTLFPDVFEMLSNLGAYTNESTGMHVNVSIEGIHHLDLNYGKLIVMLGDKHILKQFDRVGNDFTIPSIEQLANKMSTMATADANTQSGQQYANIITSIKSKMNSDLGYELMGKQLDFGKYTSVGMKNDRIEFRSPGGVDYIENWPEIQHSIDRFVTSYAIAADPEAYKKEYAKKLYKVLSSGEKVDENAYTQKIMKLFALFTAKQISKEQLVVGLKQMRSERDTVKKEKESANLGTQYRTYYNHTISELQTKKGLRKHDATQLVLAGMHIEYAKSPKPVTETEKYKLKLESLKIVNANLSTDVNYYNDVQESTSYINNVQEEKVYELNMAPGRLEKEVQRIMQTVTPIIGVELEVCKEYDDMVEPEEDLEGYEITADMDIYDVMYMFEEQTDPDEFERLAKPYMRWVKSKEPKLTKFWHEGDFLDTSYASINHVELSFGAFLHEHDWHNAMALYNDNSDWLPYPTNPDSDPDQGHYNKTVAKITANEMEDYGIDVEVEDKYHSGNRPTSAWVIEPDDSIIPNPDDSGMEIISPPMDYETGILQLEDMLAMFRDGLYYTNKSTGLHINVSIDEIDFEKLDYAKLVLLAGDDKIIYDFERELNNYTNSALTGLADYFKGTSQDTKLQQVIHSMRSGIANVGRDQIGNIDLGGYVSITIKPGYIEFRSVGNGNYEHNAKSIVDTINRFVVAYVAASDPNAYKKEYAKKLYKVLSNHLPASEQRLTQHAMQLFAMNKAGHFDAARLKEKLKDLAVQRSNIKSEAEPQEVKALKYLINEYPGLSKGVVTDLFKQGISMEREAQPDKNADDLASIAYYHLLDDPNYYAAKAANVSEQLTEARSDSVILVDFQPAYHSDDHGYIEAIENAIEYINAKQPNVTCFFNGEEVGIEDTKQEVAWHYIEMGLDEDLVYNFNFKEKTYAFLRGWMEDGHGVEESIIIKVIRYMVMNRLNDSREIEEDVFRKLVGDHWFDELYDSDNLYIPDISIGDLKALSGSLLGGGGRHECLAEIQLLMNAFNIKYKLVNDWIYG